MRGLRAVLVSAVVLLLAGCTSIPTSGPVRAGPTSAPNNPTLVSLPYPPPNGADPAEIVTGFVQAATAAPDYRVAKQFLTKDFAKRWRPDVRVLVHDQSTTTVAQQEGRVDLQVPTIATVDERGIYTTASRVRTLRYSLVRVAGQWRIGDGPDGVVLDQEVFTHNFQQTTLQYFDPTFTRLVPDLRWFASPSPTRIVRALLAGPAGPMAAPVTASAFPDETLLRALSTNAGVVTLSVEVPGAEPSAETTTRMQQQLARSLPPSTTGLRLVVDDRVVPPAAPLRPSPSDTRPAVLQNGRFGTISAEGALTEDRVLGRGIATAKPSAITVSPRQRFAAVLTNKGVELVASSTPRVVDPRRGLIAPTVDQRGWVFAVPADDPEGLVAHSTRGPSVSLPVTLGGDVVLAIEASPDGTRMLVLIRTDSGPRAYVAGIERSSDGTPIGLSAARFSVSVGSDPATDATWVDDASIAVLTTGAEGQDVTIQPLGGISSSLGRLSSAVSTIVGGAEQGGPRVLTEQTGDLYVSAGDNQWQPEFDRPVKVSVLAVQR